MDIAWTAVIIANHDGILGIIDFVISSDHISILYFIYIILEPIHQVVLAGGILCPLQDIADTHHLGSLGIIYGVATTHNHDLTTTIGNSFLQDFRYFIHLSFLIIAHYFIDGSLVQPRYIPIGIGDLVAGAHDDSGVGILRIVYLTDYTAGCSIKRCIGIRVDDIQRPYSQRRCSLKTVRIGIGRNDMITNTNGNAGNPIRLTGWTMFSGCRTCSTNGSTNSQCKDYSRQQGCFLTPPHFSDGDFLPCPFAISDTAT